MERGAAADVGLGGGWVGGWGGRGDSSRRKALRGESYRELANKLASDGERGWWRW